MPALNELDEIVVEEDPGLQGRFTKEELKQLFPDGVPLEVSRFIFECSPERTIGQIRQVIRTYARAR